MKKGDESAKSSFKQGTVDKKKAVTFRSTSTSGALGVTIYFVESYKSFPPEHKEQIWYTGKELEECERKAFYHHYHGTLEEAKIAYDKYRAEKQEQTLHPGSTTYKIVKAKKKKKIFQLSRPTSQDTSSVTSSIRSTTSTISMSASQEQQLLMISDRIVGRRLGSMKSSYPSRYVPSSSSSRYSGRSLRSSSLRSSSQKRESGMKIVSDDTRRQHEKQQPVVLSLQLLEAHCKDDKAYSQAYPKFTEHSQRQHCQKQEKFRKQTSKTTTVSTRTKTDRRQIKMKKSWFRKILK